MIWKIISICKKCRKDGKRQLNERRLWKVQFIDKENIMSEYMDRTLENLTIIENSTSKSYEVTQLINSFVGLLVLPKEKLFRNISDKIVKESTLNAIKNNVKICKNKANQNEVVNLQNIVKHLRNGVCHFRIEFYGNQGIEEICITDFFENVQRQIKIQTFEATFNVKLLRDFVVEFGKSMRDKYSPNK